MAAAAVIPTAWYGGIKEPNDIEIVRRTFLIKKLAPKLEGMTAIQISDLHLDAGSDGHARMIDLVKSLRPDLVFFTGDLVNDAGATATAEEIFRSIEAPGGTWAVLGNSDHSANVTDFLPARLASARVRYLVNESSELASGLWIVGVDDPSGGSDDLESAIQNLPDGAPAILLAHSPDIIDGLQRRPFDLVLAGHTHGGQVNLPFFNGAWLLDGPSSHYIQGLYNAKGSPLYVNRGIGTAKIPIRLGSRPEITYFTFHAA